MMNIPFAAISANRATVIRWGIAGALPLALALLVFYFFTGDDEQQQRAPERLLRMKVKHAVSGESIKLKTHERLNYAGIRTPYKNEPLYEEARKRNAELVDGKTVRVRYDVQDHDRKGRILAYVSVDGQLVNETLVREGLAYVRLTPGTKRFADTLLAAQADARKHRRGIWGQTSRPWERSYFADPKYGNFHRPGCEEVKKIKPDRLIAFKHRRQALDAGFAPCSKCLP